MIIGVTGTNGSGKDSVVDFLGRQGFHKYSLSDILRDECKKRNREITRDALIEIGNELRNTISYSVLADRIIKKLQEDMPEFAVINSIRHPDELLSLQALDNFFLIVLDAPIAMRYERVTARQQNNEDTITFERFKEQENLFGEKGDLQLQAVMDQASVVFRNTSTLQELFDRVLGFVKEKGYKEKRF